MYVIVQCTVNYYCLYNVVLLLHVVIVVFPHPLPTTLHTQEWEALSMDDEGSPLLERRDQWGFSDRNPPRIRLSFGP